MKPVLKTRHWPGRKLEGSKGRGTEKKKKKETPVGESLTEDGLEVKTRDSRGNTESLDREGDTERWQEMRVLASQKDGLVGTEG